MIYRPLKTITSHAGKYRFLRDELEDTDLVTPRIPEIPSPYAYSSVWNVYKWRGRHVILRETAHRRYQVFEVPPGAPLLPKGEG